MKEMDEQNGTNYKDVRTQKRSRRENWLEKVPWNCQVHAEEQKTMSETVQKIFRGWRL